MKLGQESGKNTDQRSLIAGPKAGNIKSDQGPGLGWEVNESNNLRRRAERDPSESTSAVKLSSSDNTQSRESSLEAGGSADVASHETSKSDYEAFAGIFSSEKIANPGPREETSEEAQKLKALHEDYKAYGREYLGNKNKAKKARLWSGIGTEEEIQRMNYLRKAYNAYQSAVYKKSKGKAKRAGSGKIGPSTAQRIQAEQLGLEQLDVFQYAYDIYIKEFTGLKNKAKTARLRAGRGPPEEIERMERLREMHDIYLRLSWRTQNKVQIGKDEFGYFTDEELQQLKELREDHKTFQREYAGGASAKANRRKLEAGQGTRAEIERMKRLRKASKTYENIFRNGRARGRKTSLELDPSLAEDLKRLEALREDRNTYAREFLRPSNEREKAKLEAGEPSPEDIARHQRLHKAYNDFQNLYLKLLGKIKKRKPKESGQDAPSDDEAGKRPETRVEGGRVENLEPIEEQRIKSDRNLERHEPESSLDTEDTTDPFVPEVVHDKKTNDSNGATPGVPISARDEEPSMNGGGSTQPSSSKNSDERNGQSQLSKEKGTLNLWSSLSSSASRMLNQFGAALRRADPTIGGNSGDTGTRGWAMNPGGGSLRSMPLRPPSGFPALLTLPRLR
ncbi:MAG: hypothetical protein M1816_003537 [Peltula sp. TS41687]|nr:MAG: hypothetical protein M1816_003537 [Peltula sp. TS41687]